MYVASVNGAPENPMRGTFFSSSFLRIFIVSRTNGIESSVSGTTSLSTADFVLTGSLKTGPFFSENSRCIPIASTGMRISEKSIAASTPNMSTG